MVLISWISPYSFTVSRNLRDDFDSYQLVNVENLAQRAKLVEIHGGLLGSLNLALWLSECISHMIKYGTP